MNEQQIALKLNDHDHEIKSLKHRVEEDRKSTRLNSSHMA